MNYNIMYKLNTLLSIILYYSEYNKIISGYINSIIKFKLFYFFIVLYNNINRIYIIRKNNLIKLYKYYYKIINNYIFGLKIKFKILGRGFKGIKKNNSITFKLGYPILCYFTFPITYRFWVKKKSKIKILSLRHKRIYSTISILDDTLYNISRYIEKIKELKIVDIYCKKGIFIRGKKVFFKKGKKAFSL